ncbi:TonB-linked outer membrane protein, SusC/RagA family [Sphingobacterium spiritivorum ATCC 33300]|uniref:TonB-linked outer membrane protein, SusC/RagA family n=2 Tax=Sphingobacterium spiritivorum TaxID=258 RepID=C2FWB4_SPHSI|nr:TonB-linked outer membrane protein, SusC/RagA family [Sphingobacterium spiritivorum ATCC 33300]QQS96434.1 SusC/RagA family TonB-linked outer membrane protein [Sphingobacterium spiritivorum]
MHLIPKECNGRLLMKISLLALILTCVTTFAAYSSNAQNLRDVKASLPSETLKLKDALRQLEKQTKIRFTYMSSDINQKTVRTNGKSSNLADILHDLLQNTDLQYQVINQTVIIKKENSTVNNIEKYTGNSRQQPIKGYVFDEKGNKLAGVTVRLKGTNLVTSTNGNGYFELSGANTSQPVLIISYIGYQLLEQAYTPTSAEGTELRLQPDLGNLDEVTVIGYGTTSKRVSTGSTAGISSDVIQRAPVNNPLEALQGRIAGLEVNSSNGLPGASFNVRLRGINSLNENANAPLYIIDGVPYFSESLNVFTGDNGSQSPLAAINPADIERIDVLKDADATAIYGSRGANGVILITTKKGSSGKTQVSFNAYTGAGKVSNNLEMLSTAEYLELRREAFANSGGTPDPETPDLFKWSQTEDQNWQKLLMGNTGKLTEANFSASGGSELTTFLISGTFRNETTVQPGDNGYKKGAGMLSINHRSSNNKFSISATANYTGDMNDALATDISQYFNLSPNLPIYDEVGDYYWYGNIQNPYAFLDRKSESRNKALLSSGTIRYSPLKGLNLSATIGYNHTALDQLQMYPKRSFNPQNSTVSMSYFGNSSISSYSIEPQASYVYHLGKGTFDVLAGTTWQQSVRDGQFLQAEDFTSDSQLDNINAAVTIRPRKFNYSKYRYQAAFARATYNYDNRYILNVTFRRDGSSRFGPDKRVGNFGSVGAAWVFTEENWLKEAVPFLNFGKLRGSYGSTGNDQIGDYGFMDSWSYLSYPYGGVAGLYPTRVANPTYSWERNRKLEGGLELAFWNSRLTLNINHYYNKSDNQLINSTLSPQTGFSGYTANMPGIVENKGWEFEVGSTNYRTDDFEWKTNANLTISRNKLVAYPGLIGSGEEGRFAIGQPLDIVFGFQFTGVDPQTGLAQFADLNGDGKVDNNLGDQYVMGTHLPKFFGGLSNSFRYKNLDVSFLLQFVKQEGEMLNFGYMSPASLGSLANFDKSALRRWRNQGDVTDIPRAAALATDDGYKSYNTFYRHSDAQWGDASFIRLKNVMVSYDFTSLLSALKTQRISLYAQGQNLFTITGYDGFDPETRGYVVPPLKYYTLGIRFTY